ncbi:hypothetical protein V1460_13395 [Streptomyces sp. SCSIO 30461]|uniref:hypothetical protein n=1 Tax=Streptomyces sp. SCSIO 30461 TaxID=3118085 RepID=UPI0030CD07E8
MTVMAVFGGHGFGRGVRGIVTVPGPAHVTIVNPGGCMHVRGHTGHPMARRALRRRAMREQDAEQ